MSTRMYVAYHDRRSLVVEANSAFQAQILAAQKFGLRSSKAHYVTVHSAKHNTHLDRYTSAGAV